MSTQTRLSYVTLDVFTTNRFTGNPLGVVRLPSGQSLTQIQKQTIAREFNYSETIFIHETEDKVAEHRIDIFMTDTELPFAGHPTIGAAWFLATSQPSNNDSNINKTIITKAGSIPYQFDTELGTVFIDVPHDVHVHKHQMSKEEAAEAGIPTSLAQKILGPSSFVSIVKGVTFVMVELPSNNILSTVTGSVIPNKLRDGLDHPWFDGVLLGTWYFVNNGWGENGTVQISSRMIMHDGALEDPATGSAASAFSVYWTKRMWADREEGTSDSFDISFNIEQGADMGRPSKIQTKVVLDWKSAAVRRVVLGGSAVQVMEGHLVI
ncbi:Diaminopimelate epimerase-like protein [Cadophora sp. DSE1049]|nr:Diaminopimelate epimerase-like protein [Cadophora sp. DSE1049]